MIKYFFLPIFLVLTMQATDALKCNVFNEDDIYKIKCKYMTVSKSFDRNISIAWTSPSAPQDDRFKTILLKAYNKSVYDFRYFDGRANGTWTITATDDSSGAVTSIQFEKQDLDDTLSLKPACEDPNKKEEE